MGKVANLYFFSIIAVRNNLKVTLVYPIIASGALLANTFFSPQIKSTLIGQRRSWHQTIPCSLGSDWDFLTVRSRGESWSAMRSLLSTGFWVVAAVGEVVTGDAFSRLWFFVLLGWLGSWVELFFEVYSAANCWIIRCMISRATRGILGSETQGLSVNKDLFTFKVGQCTKKRQLSSKQNFIFFFLKCNILKIVFPLRVIFLISRLIKVADF